MYHLETILGIAWVVATWAWLFNPKREFGDKTLTASFAIAIVMGALEIVKYGSLPG